MPTQDSGPDAIVTHLRKYGADRLWRAMATRGLDADDFQVIPSEVRGYGWKLTHEPTGQALHAYNDFCYSLNARVELLKTQPDDDPGALPTCNALDSYLAIAEEWLDEVRAANQGNHRRGVEPPSTGPADGQPADNTTFTRAEQAEIATQLKAIRDSVRNSYSLSASQLTAIDKRLEEAEEASKRLGRKDWKSLFYGIIFGMIVNDAIPPDVAQHIFAGVVHGIAHLVGGGIPPGPGMLNH
jgi:hypothetical protein